MSYILDALRRADAERERGTVPSLHTQQFGVLPGDEEAPPRPRLLIGTVVVLVLALGGVLAWSFFGGSEAPPKPPVQAVATAPPTAAPLVVAPPVVATPAFAPQSLASAAAGPSASSPMAPPPPRPAPRPPARREAAAPTMPASAPAAPAGDRIYAFAELPEAIRRELPKLRLRRRQLQRRQGEPARVPQRPGVPRGRHRRPGPGAEAGEAEERRPRLQDLPLRARHLKTGSRSARAPRASGGRRQALVCLAIRSLADWNSFLPSKPRLFMSATHSSSIADETLMYSCASALLSV